MASKELPREEVLLVLREGGQLWHFYTSGGAAVHRTDGDPVSGVYCSEQVFCALVKEGLIRCTATRQSGSPYYSGGHMNDRYSLKV